MDPLKIKVIESYYDEKLRGRVFIALQMITCVQIQYSVGVDGLQKKTKYQGRIVPDGFYVEV